MKKAALILSADWHLREDTPTCRTDDFMAAQDCKLAAIRELAEEHGCPVVIAGDVYHTWKPSPALLAWTLARLPRIVFAVAGQHDLPGHNMADLNKSGLGVLVEAGAVRLLDHKPMENGEAQIYGQSWGQPSPDRIIHGIPDWKRILVAHVLTWTRRVPFPGAKGPSADKLLSDNPDFSLIVTGDNHKPFECRALTRNGNKVESTKTSQLLVNPGSLTRQAADETHEPRVVLWYAEDNTCESVVLPHDKAAVTREHLDEQVQLDERMAAFVKRLGDGWEVGLSFERNMERFIAENGAALGDEAVRLIQMAMKKEGRA